MDKAARLAAMLPNGRGVWIPIDHGASDFPNPGLEHLDELIPQLIRAGVDVILAQKGVVNHYAHLCEGTSTCMVVHYSVSTRHAGSHTNNKVLVGQADETLARGGIGVSSQVNMGSENEPEMIERMGELNRQAHLLGLPAFGMVYARGPHLNPVEGDETGGQAHAVRLAFELGCDAAKSTWTGDAASFANVSSAAPIPVLVAGGPATGNEREVLTMVDAALKAGASGVCMGRQVFAHPNPFSMAKALVLMVHDGASVEDAIAQCDW
jgi:DhnA family fructose-bisphosphate aldolase class Ia